MLDPIQFTLLQTIPMDLLPFIAYIELQDPKQSRFKLVL